MSETILTILKMVLPFIGELIKSEVVPALKRKAYQRLDDSTSDRIEDLSNLVEKINSCTDETKKKAHLEGLKLGIETLTAISSKLNLACAEFSKTLEEK